MDTAEIIAKIKSSEATNQEIFDTAWQWFVVEKNPASHLPTGQCKYRGPNGKKCAFGIFIADEDYCIDMEEKLAGSVMNRAGLFSYKGYSDLFCSLQSAHDNASCYEGDAFTADVKHRLVDIASSLHLSVPRSLLQE
jgi:hypothetical protein